MELHAGTKCESEGEPVIRGLPTLCKERLDLDSELKMIAGSRVAVSAIFE
jgi:hypothetical protein